MVIASNLQVNSAGTINFYSSTDFNYALIICKIFVRFSWYSEQN